MPFPRVHILGAAKSATSTLHAVLTSDAAFCGCNGESVWPVCQRCVANKELSLWWGFNLSDALSNLSAERYSRCFEPPTSSRCAVAVDSSPSRLHEWFAPFALKRLATEAGIIDAVRLVVLLREPVSRHLSWYNHRLVDHGVWLPREGRYRSFWEMASNPEVHNTCEGRYGALLHGVAPSHSMLARCEIERWQRASCSLMSGPDARTGCWLRQMRGVATATWLVKSMYEPQLRLWGMHWARKQLLVVSFDQLLQDGAGRVLEFVGLPSAQSSGTGAKLPHKHVLDSPCRVAEVECSVLHDMQDVYDPWNRALYDRLSWEAGERPAMGSVPPWSQRPIMEANFPPFAPPRSCTERELRPVNLTMCACWATAGRADQACGHSTSWRFNGTARGAELIAS